MFQHFGQRLKRDLKQLVDRRLDASVTASGSVLKVRQVYSSSASTRKYLLISFLSSLLALKWMSSHINANDTQSGSAVLC
jgi:actin-related protein 3